MHRFLKHKPTLVSSSHKSEPNLDQDAPPLPSPYVPDDEQEVDVDKQQIEIFNRIRGDHHFTMKKNTAYENTKL